MRRIIYYTMISLNGYMEKPGGSLDWVIVDEELFRFMNNLERQIGGYLWGRGMYENNQALLSTADAQPMQDYEVEFVQIWKQIPTIVFSSTLERVEGNARLERGDPVAVVTRLKEQPGPDLEVGGVQLVPTLIQAGLVDEYHIFVQPILLGDGRPIFPVVERGGQAEAGGNAYLPLGDRLPALPTLAPPRTFQAAQPVVHLNTSVLPGQNN